MKKTILMIGIVSMLTVGAAYAAENQAVSEKGETLYNGITYFNLGSGTPGPAAEVRETAKQFNGITVFDQEQPRTNMSVARVKFAASSNGITVF